MKSFKITNYDTRTNKKMIVLVTPRAFYQDMITSEKKLLKVLQNSIIEYHNKNMQSYAEALNKKLNDGHILELCSIFGIFSTTKTLYIENKK
jgi:hypothetical protein